MLDLLTSLHICRTGCNLNTPALNSPRFALVWRNSTSYRIPLLCVYITHASLRAVNWLEVFKVVPATTLALPLYRCPGRSVFGENSGLPLWCRINNSYKGRKKSLGALPPPCPCVPVEIFLWSWKADYVTVFVRLSYGPTVKSRPSSVFHAASSGGEAADSAEREASDDIQSWRT